MMPAERRRHAAALAAYLAQFLLDVDIDDSRRESLYLQLPDKDLAELRRDYLQAEQWAQSAAFTDEDTEALAVMCRRYSFQVR